MRIKKTFQGEIPENKIVNMQSDSQTDTYSCDYANLLAYPIGSLYISDNSTSPASLFGGTWEQINGYYPYFGNTYNKTTYTGKNTQSHTLTVDEMPSHDHKARYGDTAGGDGSGYRFSNTNGTNRAMIENEGGGQGHSHNIATVELYAWRRTA